MALFEVICTLEDVWQGKTRIYYSAVYDPVTNQTTVTFESGDFSYFGVRGYNTSATADIIVTAKDNPSSSKKATMSHSNTTGGGVERYEGTLSPASVTVQHSGNAGKKSIEIYCSPTIDVWISTSGESRMVTSGYVVVVTGERKGYYCIDNGSKILQVIPYIDNGSKWLECIPYVDNGSAWKVGS